MNEQKRAYWRAYKKKRWQDPEYREKRIAESLEYYHKKKDDPEFKAYRSAYHAKWQRENKDRWNAYNNEYRRKRKEQNGT